jgi:hypothetical protein
MKNLHERRLSKTTRRLPLRMSLLVTAIAFSGPACETAPDQKVDTNGEKIIGGFAANDPALDAIGSLVIHFPNGGPFPPAQEFCGATLIGPETVLTAKHCAVLVPQIISAGLRLTFAVGSSSLYPKHEVNIVGVELAPGDPGGFLGTSPDVAVMHLETPINDLAPVDLAVLSDEQIAQAFAAIGYGIQDNLGTNGTRRLGKQTLRSRRGRVFEAMFGNFENFLEWFKNGTVPAAGVASGALGPEMDGGPGEGGPGGGPSFPPPPSVDELARQIYDSALLAEEYEVVTGGAPGDAQPCFGDSGSSLIRRLDQRFVSFGVVSWGVGSRDSICDVGTVYATFGPGVLGFLQIARTWVDPCGDLDSRGSCDGNTAQRCTDVTEGRRRMVNFDCGALGMTCNTTSGQVSCDGNAFGPPPPMPAPGGGKVDPRKAADNVFMSASGLAGRRGQP